MKTILASQIKEAVKKGFLEIGVNLDPLVIDALKKAKEKEIADTLPNFALNVLIKNAEIAKQQNCAVCQDTGMAVVFLEVGKQVFIEGDAIIAVNEGVREAYSEGCFRKSVLDPLTRLNTKDNTPAVVHYQLVDGDNVVVKMMAKGFGSENMSRLFMLPPSAGIEGVKNAIIKTVADAGSNPCPPVILGVGIGGTMEKCALMSKQALFRNLGSANEDPNLDLIEKEVLEKINQLNIGAGGYGGKTTALGVFIKSYPTHLAGLPVAISVNCHASRHKEVVL